MTRDEIEIVMRLLCGHWPMPEMGEDETTVWARTLLPLDLETVVEAVDGLSESGMHFRPTDGEVLARYREMLCLRKPASLDEGPVCSPEQAKENLAQLRKLARSVGRAVPVAVLPASSDVDPYVDPITAKMRAAVAEMRAVRLAREATEREQRGAAGSDSTRHQGGPRQ